MAIFYLDYHYTYIIDNFLSMCTTNSRNLENGKNGICYQKIGAHI